MEEEDESLFLGDISALFPRPPIAPAIRLHPEVILGAELNVFSQLQSICYKLPMPSNTERILSARGFSKSNYSSINSEQYGGCAVELYKLLRMMKWYYFIINPLFEWSDVKRSIIKLFVDKRIFSVKAINE